MTTANQAAPLTVHPDIARIQITAGAALLHQSKLLEWTKDGFIVVDPDAFEYSARHDVDRAYGRLICWLTFSAGAEYLAKGLCLAYSISSFLGYKPVPIIPTHDVDSWLAQTDGCAPGLTPTEAHLNFGTFGSITNGNPSPLQRLATHCAPNDDGNQRLVIGAFRLLGSSIRNRDSHAHVPNVRLAHFDLVRTLFLPAITLLVDWIPDGGPSRLQQWLDEAPEFLRTL